ncbi:MAG TPA: LacI family DNA-binding transcriptional regulator [Jiangellaceae bacterium]|nr:LacI family DNA-binding transcriptional regulator [Jiangellaceae bacterium]
MKRPHSTSPRARAPKLATVAKAAGVSIGLASRVINEDPTVSVRPETRRRVLATAERLQYVPQASAQALRQRRTKVIGLAVHDLASTLVVKLLEGAREEAVARGYLLLLTDADELAFTPESRRLYLGGARIDGLILQDGHASMGDAIDEIGAVLPTVVFNTPGRTLSPGVLVDESLAGRLAAKHLIELGHREIGFIGGVQGTHTNDARLDGARRAMAEAGLASSLHVVDGDWTAPGGFHALNQLVGERPEVTGVVTVNVSTGTGAIAAALDSSVSVPQMLSVVAIQDAWTADFTVPRMSTVVLPLRELGQEAVRLLIRYIDGEDVEESHVVAQQPYLHPRESAAPPRLARARREYPVSPG